MKEKKKKREENKFEGKIGRKSEKNSSVIKRGKNYIHLYEKKIRESRVVNLINTMKNMMNIFKLPQDDCF